MLLLDTCCDKTSCRPILCVIIFHEDKLVMITDRIELRSVILPLLKVAVPATAVIT